MSEETGSWLPALLERASESLVWPATPNLSGKVAAAIRAPFPAARPKLLPRLALAILVLLAISATTALVNRDIREAVAGFLGLGVEGYRVEIEPSPAPGATPTLPPTPFVLERSAARITFEGAASRLGQPVRLADGEQPDAVFFFEGEGVETVVLRYPGFDLWQYRGELQTLVKLIVFGGETSVDNIQVNERPGYWVRGGPRFVTFTNASGTPSAGSARVVQTRALTWSSGTGLTLRIEGDLELEQALEIAENVR